MSESGVPGDATASPPGIAPGDGSPPPGDAGSAGTALGPGAEFDLVRRMVGRWGMRARGLGDDAAVLDLPPGERLVVSTDTSVEDVHFRRDWSGLREIARRATVAALSDLAAMAAAPVGLVVAATLTKQDLTEIDALADGIGEAAERAGCPIVGGDLTHGDRLCLTITVLGHAVAPLPRSGVRVGDRLYLTGRLGGPAAAIDALRRGAPPLPEHRARFADPRPRIAEARWLAHHGAHAMIDISDGLASELRHLAAASRVHLAVALERVPCVPGVPPEAAAVSGEEYELLCAAPHELDTRAFEREFGVPLSEIGWAMPGGPSVGTVLHGSRVDLGGGYDHFAP